MLTHEELRYNFATYKFLTRVSFLPLKYDGDGRCLNLLKGNSGNFVYKCWLYLTSLQCFNLMYGLMVVLTSDHKKKDLYLPMAVGFAVLSVLSVYTNVTFNVYWPDLNMCLFNEAHAVRPTKTITTQQHINKKKVRSPADLFLIFLPFILLPASLDFPVYYFYDKNIPIVLCARIPLQLQHISSFVMTLVIDTLGSLFWMTTIYHGCFMIFSFEHHFNSQIDLLIGKINRVPDLVEREATNDLRKVARDMRKLQLYLNLFNLAFANVVFSVKLVGLSTAIICGFFTIRYYQEYTLIACITAVLEIDAICMFVILFDKAFILPEKMANLKAQFKVVSDFRRQALKDEFRVVSESFSTQGMMVGGFRTLERESTPTFIDFVFSQITSLLLTVK